MPSPEDQARENIDQLLTKASWAVCNQSDLLAREQIRIYRDKLFTEIFPGRTEVPKTLIFAEDDSHAEDIVKIVQEEFGKDNDFARKITYLTTGKTPEDIIAVTVDMIATVK